MFVCERAASELKIFNRKKKQPVFVLQTSNAVLKSVLYSYFEFDVIVLFCRPLTKQRRDLNLGWLLGGKRERFIFALLATLPPPPRWIKGWFVEVLKCLHQAFFRKV